MSGSSEEKVSIKLEVRGVEVELECREDQIQSSIAEVLEGIKSSGDLETRGREESDVQPQTCKEVIEELWSEGWLSEERRLGDVWKEMKRRGYHYDRSAVSHALLDLVREGVLTRLGKPRKYRYVSKTPVKEERRIEVKEG